MCNDFTIMGNLQKGSSYVIHAITLFVQEFINTTTTKANKSAKAFKTYKAVTTD